MLALTFAVLFALMFLSWSLATGHARRDLLLPGGVLALFVWFAVSRKTVQMDDRFLYVSVLRRVVTIPLDQVSRVTESIGMKDRSVTIHFRTDTPCGRSITFSPTLMLTRDPHPIVSELLAYAHQHQQTGSA
jgi:hypothetical protein